jgi:predicted transcriptional regulator
LGDRGTLGDQLDDLLGRHLLTKNKAGDLVPLADEQRVMRHNPTLPVLTAEQEAELFAPVDTGRMTRMAMLQPKSKISRELDHIKNKNNNKKKNKSLDMILGGLVRTYN